MSVCLVSAGLSIYQYYVGVNVLTSPASVAQTALCVAQTAVCVVLASAGYPRSSEKGRCISGLEVGSEEGGVVVFVV